MPTPSPMPLRWWQANMKLYTTLLLSVLLHVSMMASGQIEYFKFYSRVSFMPAGGFKKETYEMQKNRLFHFSETLSYKKPKEIIKTVLPNDKKFELEIKDLDSLLKLKMFSFSADSNLADNLKGDKIEKEYYHLQDKDIDNFFKGKKSITMSVIDIKLDTLDEFTVVDGSPFAFYFAFKIANQDTTEFKYFGNLDDGIKTKNIREWLVMYIVIKKYKLFSTNKYMTEFFDDKHFNSVLFRFINWNRL
jgi:hypothetical protein